MNSLHSSTQRWRLWGSSRIVRCMRFLKKCMYRITGGRPMEHIRWEFTDDVLAAHVYLWIDGNGRFWLATNRWGPFRVEAKPPL